MAERHDNIRNLAGVAYLAALSLEVAEYHPDPGGQGRPTEVHFLIHVKGARSPVILRLKSARACGELIDALVKHRAGVFGAR